MTANPNAPISEIRPTSMSAATPSGQPAPASSTPPGEPRPLTAIEIWLHRITVLLFVFVCATAGVLLVILPWRPEWTENHLLQGSPWLRAVLASGFVRGLVSGIGVLDIWIGFWEAVHYREHRGS